MFSLFTTASHTMARNERALRIESLEQRRLLTASPHQLDLEEAVVAATELSPQVDFRVEMGNVMEANTVTDLEAALKSAGFSEDDYTITPTGDNNAPTGLVITRTTGTSTGLTLNLSDFTNLTTVSLSGVRNSMSVVLPTSVTSLTLGSSTSALGTLTLNSVPTTISNTGTKLTGLTYSGAANIPGAQVNSIVGTNKTTVTTLNLSNVTGDLDLSEYTNLTSLTLTDCDLGTLSVSPTNALTAANSNSTLTGLVASGAGINNAAFNNLISGSTGTLTTVSANGCTSLTDIGISGYYVLETVSMTNCTGLTTVNFGIGNKALNSVDLSGSKVTTSVTIGSGNGVDVN
ncbi:MAG: hypothetical protein Q4D38_14565, partial [Planctomycetia bacterium]|nr:hypothetical protein [Planctomycetia bacterium]